jgi:uncharacterized protein (TIGR02246 family)
MKRVRYLVLTVLVAAVAANGYYGLAGAAASTAQGSRSADEDAIRKADVEWSHAAETRNVEKAVSFYAEDGSMMPFGAPIATGKEQIRETWTKLMSVPGVHLTFAPTKIVVAKAGDLAYDIGTFELKTNDAQGNTTSSVGKYVVVWKKVGGQWKVAADIFNTDK